MSEAGRGTGSLNAVPGEHQKLFSVMYSRASSLGSGSFGAVVQLYNNSTGDLYAGKIFLPDDDEDLPVETLRELAFLRIFSEHPHENIVTLVDACGSIDGQRVPLAVLPLLPRTLASVIGTDALKTRERMLIAKGLSEGLTHLHSSQPPIVHRDLKPENVLLGGDEAVTPVLIDFSFTKHLYLEEQREVKRKKVKRGVKKTSPEEAKNTEVLGTPTYIAPEILKREPYGTPVDIWALGVVLLELFQNSRLETDKDSQALRILRDLKSRLSDKPVPRLIKQCLDEEQSLRPSAGHVCAELGGRPSSGFPYFEEGGPPHCPEIREWAKRLDYRGTQTIRAAEVYRERMHSSRHSAFFCVVVAGKLYEYSTWTMEDLEDFMNEFNPCELDDFQMQLLEKFKYNLLVPYPLHRRDS